MSYHWSIECTAALHEYVAAGISHPSIARRLNARFNTNYNKSSVCKKLIRLKEPKLGRTGSVFWPDNIKARLVELYSAEPPVSFTDMVDILKNEFGCNYSRSAIIGCSARLGLKGKKSTPSVNKPKLRIVSANSNSTRKRIIQSVESEEKIVLRCVEIEPRNIPLANLEPNDCRYIPGDDLLYCAHPQKPGSSYCPAHHALVYVKAITTPRPSWKRHGTDFSRRSA